MSDHKYTRRGPGIPACTCGEVFEWTYEYEGHVKTHERHREDHPMTTRDLWHTPYPGPWPSWDWRCRICSEPVDDHPGLIRRLIHRWRTR